MIYLTGVASRLCHLFSGEGAYIEDFIHDPEKYLHWASLLNTLLIGFVAFWSGKKIFHYASSISLAILFQTVLFTNSSTIEICARLIPESTMLIPIFLLAVLGIKYMYSDHPSINKNRLIWQFSALIAFGTACKLFFAPMFLFPLILLGTDLKSVLSLIWRTILFTCLFAYPLLTNISESFEWISELLLHSGKHGTGDSNFMDTSHVLENIKIILKKDLWFWVLFVSQIILAMRSKSKKVFRLSLALSISMLFILLFTLKHFAIHYIMPFYGFKTLFLIIIWLSIKELKIDEKIKTRPQVNIVISLLLLISILIPQTFDAKNNYSYTTYRRNEANQQQLNFEALLPESNYSLIVDAPYWGAPFPEYGNVYGFMNSYRRKTTFKDELRKKYPDFYCYVGWSESFNHWDQFVDFNDVFKSNEVAIIYIGPNMKGYDTIIKRLKQSGINHALEELFMDQKTKERLVKVSRK